jgi:aminoglycoside N3'-acetyltransferase
MGREHRRGSETEVIAGTAVPASVESLRTDLRALGLPAGGIVMVHSSLSRLGYVVGARTRSCSRFSTPWDRRGHW